tara:strand:+ start:531 stop:758 length:228 start_codon:yes stop_codon:yes gene_type:complete
MFEIDETLMKVLFIYLLSCYMLYTIKHPKMFHENGDFKCFGLHHDETVYPFWLVTTLIGITSYYLILISKGNYVR